MSGKTDLQEMHPRKKEDRPGNLYVGSMYRRTRDMEDGSDYVTVRDDVDMNLYMSIGDQQSRGIEDRSDYNTATDFTAGNVNEGYETLGEIDRRRKDFFANQEKKSAAESIDIPVRTVSNKYPTKKKVVIGTVVTLIIVGVGSAVVSLLTLKQDGDGKLKSLTDNQKQLFCPDAPSPGMKYTATEKTGIQGRQFLVCFTENHYKARNQSKTVYILSEEDFEFKLISKFLDSTQLYNEVDTQTPNMKEINVTNTIALSDLKVEPKALLIETTKDVSVIIIDNYIHSSDSSVILPIKSLSNSYVISIAYSIFNNTLPSSHFAIASKENGTIIKIYFHFDPDLPIKVNGITYRNGSEMILVLNELETFQIWHTVDVSGTLINATSPVAVFAGNFCEKIAFENSSDFGTCSKLDEQLPPIDRLDKMYIVPPYYKRKGTVLKVVSPFENRLTYKIGNKEIEKTLKPNGYFEITFLDDEVVVIDSRKPVLVTSFAAGSDVTGDPYMITVPGIRQYMDKYLVTVPGNFENNYIGLIVEEPSLNNLILNETEIIHYLNDRKFYATATIKDVTFVVLVLQVPGGMLKIQSTNSAAFGLVVYGHRKADGHGFAGKAVLPDMCVHSNK